MNNKLYIASAGAGKTTKLINDAIERCTSMQDSNKIVAIVTYTQKNQEHAQHKIANSNYRGKSIKVYGWYEFLLRFIARPFKVDVIPELRHAHIGLLLVNNISGKEKSKNGQYYSTYREGDKKTKYLTQSGYKIYSDKLSEFCIECYESNRHILIPRLERIFDSIYFDEAQDFTGYDFDIIKLILKSKILCTIACDPRQHTYDTHATTKYKKYKGKIDLFCSDVLNKRKELIKIDNETLQKSWRCPKCICDFASKIMPEYPLMISNKEDRIGQCILITKQYADVYTQLVSPIALIWNETSKKEVSAYSESVYNLGEVKGIEFENVVIYPTKTMLKWMKNMESSLPDTSKAKFYVGVTRAMETLAIIVPDNFTSDWLDMETWHPDCAEQQEVHRNHFQNIPKQILP